MSTVTKDTKLFDLLEEYPWLREEMVKVDKRFQVLNTPIGKPVMRRATVDDIRKNSGLSLEEILEKIQELIDAGPQNAGCISDG